MDDRPEPQLAEEMVPADLRWRLRLLISVDLVGSTALKQRSAMVDGDLEPWLPWFRGFYEALVPFLQAQYKQLPDPVQKDATALPTLWKYNGDEVLLRTELSNASEALIHVVALRQAVCTWRARWADGLTTHSKHEGIRKRRFPLDIKATAWLAGFPVSNAVVGDDPDRPEDFVGPQVDLGFRLARLATRTELVVDAGLAYLLAEALAGTAGPAACQFRFLGRHRFKGILEGLPYPVFAIAAEHGLVSAELALEQGEQRPLTDLDPQRVSAFCEEFHRDTLGIVRPFIWGDRGGQFGYQPEYHEALERRRQGLIDSRQKQGYVPAGVDEEAPEGVTAREVAEAVEPTDPAQ